MKKSEIKDSNEKFEKILLDQLSSSKLTKDQLRQFSNTIVELKKKSIIPERIWRYGQPAIDGIMVEGRLSLDKVSNLGEIVKNPLLRGVEVFPLGIPFPDVLELRLKIGEQIQQFQR